MPILDLPLTTDGSTIDFAVGTAVSGLQEYRQAVVLRLSNTFTFNRDQDGNPEPFGLDLAAEIGKTDSEFLLGARATAAISNDPRFTATLLDQRRRVVQGVAHVELSFEVIVDETQETFSLDVLVANGEVRLTP